MVEDRVTDGKRIAQLLASELSGRERGGLADVSVVEADPDVEPAPEGRVGYRVAVDDVPAVTVRLYPEAAVLDFVDSETDTTGSESSSPRLNVTAVRERARDAGLATDDGRVRVDSGAAVKRALDAVRAGL
jgi:hypothetical protein